MTDRSRQLDVLRGLAVLLVITYHYPYHSVMDSGWMGVDLFFVLSGFLISGLLFSDICSRGSISFRRFFIRRGLKIYPAFYFYLGLTALLFPDLRPYWFSQVFFLQSYYPAPSQASMWVHTWSLAIEEHFYILLPVILALLNRRKALRHIPAVSIALIAGCLVSRIITARYTADIEKISFPTHLRIDSLFAGVSLGYFYRFRRDKFSAASRWWTAPLGLLFLLPALLSSFDTGMIWASLRLTCNLVGFSLILLWAVTRSYLRSRVLEEIGRYSYSIYLWHMLVTSFWHAHPISFFGFCGNLATCLAIGIAMALVVETPVLFLRDRYFPSRGRPLCAPC